MVWSLYLAEAKPFISNLAMQQVVVGRLAGDVACNADFMGCYNFSVFERPVYITETRTRSPELPKRLVLTQLMVMHWEPLIACD